MWITREEAVVMYANFCRAHYGFNAHQKVEERAKQLAQDGDLEGEKIWNQVAALKKRLNRIEPFSLSFRVRFKFLARVVSRSRYIGALFGVAGPNSLGRTSFCAS